MKGDYTVSLLSDDILQILDHSQMKGDYTKKGRMKEVKTILDHSQMKGDYTHFIVIAFTAGILDHSRMKGDQAGACFRGSAGLGREEELIALSGNKDGVRELPHEEFAELLLRPLERVPASTPGDEDRLIVTCARLQAHRT